MQYEHSGQPHNTSFSVSFHVFLMLVQKESLHKMHHQCSAQPNAKSLLHGSMCLSHNDGANSTCNHKKCHLQ